MGQGPPSDIAGWVRTGWAGYLDSGPPGQINCYVWTSNSGALGSAVSLSTDWTATGAMHGWEPSFWGCHLSLPVWCVED